MKKFFVAISLILIWCMMIVSCNTNHVDTSLDSNINNTQSNTNNQDTTDTHVPNDEEFPFDNIIVERNGYDIVAAGKYYGNDFDNVKDYGSYYRIIDNYEDFSELTQWGNQLNEAILDENFVLVLHTYKSKYVYYSDLSEKGSYVDFKFDASSNSLIIKEQWKRGNSADAYIDSNGNVIEVPQKEPYKNEFPADIFETIYLLIPIGELPNSLSNNGEIELKSEIIELE